MATAKNNPLAPDAAFFNLPVFEIRRTSLVNYFGEFKKNPRKFLIRILFWDITNTASANSKLLLYPADHHKDFAAMQSPIEVPGTNASSTLSSKVIIGGLEFDTKDIIIGPGGELKPFDLLRFTPIFIIGEDGRNNHLAFKVVMVTVEKDDQDGGDANPSPPKTPTYLEEA